MTPLACAAVGAALAPLAVVLADVAPCHRPRVGGLPGTDVPALASGPGPAPVVAPRRGAGRLAVAVGTVGVCAAVGTRPGGDPALPALLAVGVVGVVLAAVDVRTRRLPDVVTLPAYPLVGALLLLAAARGDAWHQLGRAVAGMVVLFGFYLAQAVLTRDALGFGDVKFAGVLGLALGWLGWGALVLGTLVGYLLGALAGLVVAVRTGGGRRTAVPFGPAMAAGALVAIVAGPALLRAYAEGLGV